MPDENQEACWRDRAALGDELSPVLVQTATTLKQARRVLGGEADGAWVPAAPGALAPH